MIYLALAYLTVLLHLAFILFVPLGGCLVLWRRGWAWLHVPAFFWGALISFAGWVCPLTPLENRLRLKAGAAGYAGGFIEHYLLALIYPAELTRALQTALGAAVLLLNLAVYGIVIRKARLKAP